MEEVTKRIIDVMVAAVLYDYSHFDIEISYEETETGLTFMVFGDGNRSAAYQLRDRIQAQVIPAAIYYNNVIIPPVTGTEGNRC